MEVEEEPIINGWFTRLVDMNQGCQDWSPIPISCRWDHCELYESNHTGANGTVQIGFEDTCPGTLQAQTATDPDGYIVNTDIVALCELCKDGHGRKKGTAQEWKPKKKGDKDDGKPSKYKKGKTTHFVYTDRAVK